MEKVLSSARKPLVLMVVAGALAVGLGSENYTTGEVNEGNLTTSLHPDAGSDGQAEMMNETAQCDSKFKANFFKIFLDEGCLAAMEPTESIACPVNEAEKFLDEVFAEFHASAMCMAPLWLYIYVTVALLGNVPNPDVEGDAGRQRGHRVLYCLWVACQAGTALFQILSVVWYILAYASMRGQMGDCLTLIGPVTLLDLMMPVWVFQMAVISRFAPLAVTAVILYMEVNDRRQAKQRRREAVEDASEKKKDKEAAEKEKKEKEAAKKAKRDFEMLMAAVLFFWIPPFILGFLYYLVFFGIVFSIVFIPISLCAAGALGIGVLLSQVLVLGFEKLLLSLRDNNIDLIWFVPPDKGSDGYFNMEDPFVSVCKVSMYLIIMAPLITFGTALSWTVLGSKDGAQAIDLIYEYIFVADLKLPSFFSMTELLQLLEDPTIIFELHKFMELPPYDVVLASAISVGLGTVLSILRSIVFSLNAFLFTVSNGKCGYESRPMAKVRLELHGQPEADKE